MLRQDLDSRFITIVYMLLTIDADFGSRKAARRLLPVVNRVLSTLRVRQAGHG